MPQKTLDLVTKHHVAIKGPLTTPVGGGIRSLNVALRQKLDLYACVRPVRWFEGVPSPVKEPGLVDMVIFRENTEDIYAGIEWMHGTDDVETVNSFLMNELRPSFAPILFSSLNNARQKVSIISKVICPYIKSTFRPVFN